MAVDTVLNTNDAGPGSLREVIASASAGDTIDLRNLTGAIALSSGEIAIDKSLTLLGPGASSLTLAGNDASRVFNIFAGVSISISDVEISHGHSDSAGGAIYSAGDLS